MENNLSRRSFIAGAGAFAGLARMRAFGIAEAARKRRLNVLFIMTDDHAYALPFLKQVAATL